MHKFPPPPEFSDEEKQKILQHILQISLQNPAQDRAQIQKFLTKCYFGHGFTNPQREVLLDLNWRRCLFIAGRGAGKSTLATALLAREILKAPAGSEFAYLAQSFKQARTILVENNETSIQQFLPSAEIYQHQIKYKGSFINISGMDKTSKGDTVLRGSNARCVIVDEALFATKRLITSIIGSLRSTDGTARRLLFCTTPQVMNQNLENVREVCSNIEKGGKIVNAPSMSNPFLDEEFFQNMRETLGEGSIGWRSEVLGEIITETPDSVFSTSTVDKAVAEAPENFDYVCLSIDPAKAVSDKESERGSANGMCVVGMKNGTMYLLADITADGNPVDTIEHGIYNAYNNFSARKVFVEDNAAGAFSRRIVEDAVRKLGGDITIRYIHASKSKLDRFLSLAGRMEGGKVKISSTGNFTDIRKQMSMVSFTDDTWKKQRCDRVDAFAQAAIAVFGGTKGL